MPHISNKDLDLKTKRQITETLNLVLGKSNKEEARSFLNSLLTDTERLMLPKRLAIAILLKEGVEQSQIAEAFCVTRETVNRIELALLKRPEGFELALKKINEDKFAKEIKKKILGLASYSIKAAGGRVDSL